MSPWKDGILTAIYTLGPVHCGTGQTTGAVDLPIARDASTDLPVLPATSLKGVAREAFEENAGDDADENEVVTGLFGPTLDDSDKSLFAGALAFTEGRLLAYPLRSLNRPFLHATCPLILERFQRDLRALGLQDYLACPPKDLSCWEADHAYVSDDALAGEALVIEDLVYHKDEVVHSAGLQCFAGKLRELLPESESLTAQRLASGLVVLPDSDFQDAVNRAIPAQARIVLTGGKTTSKWINPENGQAESGNLWYEEALPSDCLFVAFVGQRRQHIFRENGDGKATKRLIPLKEFKDRADWLKVVQIGGNETVGQGLCCWTPWDGRKESS